MTLAASSLENQMVPVPPVSILVVLEHISNPEDLIENYLGRFKEIVERNDPENREIGMQALKKVLLDKFVTKFEEIPQGYWDLNDIIKQKN